MDIRKSHKCYPNIKFEYEMSKSEINFLDSKDFKLDNKMRAYKSAPPALKNNRQKLEYFAH